MNFVSRIFRIFFSIYALIVFLVTMFLVFPFIILASFLPHYKRGNLFYRIFRIWADIGMFFWGIRSDIVYESALYSDRPSIFVFNHISYLDAIILVKSIRKNHFRGLGKVELSAIPVFGYIYKSAVITVKRDDKNDRARSVKDLKDAIANNISIALAPEGTFNMSHKPLEKFYDGAFKIAIETQTNIRPLLILDSYDRMHYRNLFTMNPGKSRVVFLEEISSAGYSLEQMCELKEKVYRIMEDALIRYKASWIKH